MRSLFDSATRSVRESLDETAELLSEYGPRYSDWAIAYSGGKDSSALLTAVLHLIGTGEVAQPKRLFVRYADTLMELPPLARAAQAILTRVGEMGFDSKAVFPDLDYRFYVYMLGRGVPPPSNTFRWCTDQLKIEPMEEDIRKLSPGRKVLMMTGVRLGESARRDQSIAVSCSRDGAECGQGRIHLALAGDNSNDINRYFIPGSEEDPCDTLAPILHWRVCHVWDWLLCEGESPDHQFLDLTEMVADAYGDGQGSQLIETAARTGCVGCNLASKDVALERLARRPEWSHLGPLMGLRPLYAELKKPGNRLRKPGGERRKDGTLCKNQNRMGPLTMNARLFGLKSITAIQDEVCRMASNGGRPDYLLIDPEQRDRILQLIDANTWPDGWTGTEPVATEDHDDWHADGSVQRRLF